MIVVSGFPRSGTSVMMLILERLGLQITGERDPNQRPDLNPTGLWEIPGVVNGGLQEPIPGDVVKLTNRGLFASNPSLINGIIYCIREPREIVVSHRSLINYGKDEWIINGYIVEGIRMIESLSPEEWTRICVVDYGDLMRNPKKQVKRIARFLGVKATKKAINTPKRKYYRSRKDEASFDEASDNIYKYFRGKIC